MSKAYWVATYRAVKDPDKLAAYAKLAGPALTDKVRASWRVAYRPRFTNSV